jgi:hypothetical protein
MVKNNQQNKYPISLFLNEYFNVLVIGFIIIIFALAYFLLIGPKFKSTTTVIKENIETQKKLYAEQEKKLKDLKTIKSIYEKISPADLNKFNGVLPDYYIKEQLFGELEEIIVDSGFLIGSVSITSDEVIEEGGEAAPTIGSNAGGIAGERVGKITVSVTIAAIDYSGFKNMLKTFEANSRLFDIENVSFSEAGNSAQLELVTYYYKPLK